MNSGTQILEIILRYATRLICTVGFHTHKRSFICTKHNRIFYLCKLCQCNAAWNHNSYICPYCCMHFCFSHFIDHCLLFNHLEHNYLSLQCYSTTVKITEPSSQIMSRTYYYRLALHLSSLHIQLQIFKDIRFKQFILMFFMVPNHFQDIGL